MAYSYDVRFHCTQGVQRQGKKSKHSILSHCKNITKVLTCNPDYGISVSRFGSLKKMRIAIPKFHLGKSGGYRLIYSKTIIGQVVYVVFLSVYFKSDISDLNNSTYSHLVDLSKEIFNDPLSYAWEDTDLIE